MSMSAMQTALGALLREAFEGRVEGKDYTWFVQDRECIFDVLDRVDAADASRTLRANVATIAAHAFHIRFALASANAERRGESHPGTWESSWAVQSVDSPEWSELSASIRSEYTEFLSWFESNQDWSDSDALLGACAMVPHMAFHLGAMRQLMKFI